MRTKDEILQRFDDCIARIAPDMDTPLIATQQLTEVLIDIRDILRSEISGIARSLYIISKQP